MPMIGQKTGSPQRIPLPVGFAQTRLDGLITHVQGCRACPRMEGRKRVLTKLNGNAPAWVMFVAEAPGRNGAERTGIPLHGDPSGVNFERLLTAAGFRRSEVFITNAVLCNPQDKDGNNSTPTDQELRNCSFNLEQQIQFVNPFVIVTLGAKPLAALNIIRPHNFTLSGAVGQPQLWNGRTLFPVYHPSPRAMIYRKSQINGRTLYGSEKSSAVWYNQGFISQETLMPKVGEKAIARSQVLPRKNWGGTKKYNAIGSYIFAGGFTVGVMEHFNIHCHLEETPYGVDVAKKNFKFPIHVGKENWPITDLKKQKWDFIYGNPPCAAWSGNNPNSHTDGGQGWRTDPRVNCTKAFFQLLTELKPTVWAWESVTQAPAKGKEFVDDLTRQALKAGYSVSYVFLDAQYCGTPQIRRRWFMVCHRVQLKFAPCNFDSPESAVDCLKKVKPRGTPAYDSGRFQKLFEHRLHMLPAGGRLRKFWEMLNPEGKRELKPNGHVKGRVGLGHVRLKDKGPATATVGYSMVHPTQHRFLHLNEIQALAGFPQWFDFGGKGNYAKELDLVARGVCPPVGEWLARTVKMSVDANVMIRKPTVTLYDFRNEGIPPCDLTNEFIK
jgi:uracil-DNA glycosylase family 4